MIHEVTITFTAPNNKGDEKVVKEQYLVENRNLFAEVEDAMYVEFDGAQDLDVVSIKRSKIREIANTCTNNLEEKIYVATLVDVFLNNDGTEKEIKYQIAFYSTSMSAANAFINQYVSQGYKMKIAAIKETKFEGVIQ